MSYKPVVLAYKGRHTFESMDKILKNDHPNGSYSAPLSYGAGHIFGFCISGNLL